MNAPSRFLFPQLLADRKLNPAALLLRFAGEGDSGPSPATQEKLDELVSGFLCFVVSGEMERVSPAWAEAMRATAGCRELPPDQLHPFDPGDKAAPEKGAAWLSGDWYLTPPPKPTSSQLASRALALKLVQLVSIDADTHAIEDIFRRDPALSYHLLRLVNSPSMGMNTRITSFAQAILILGRQQLRRWLNLMLFSARKEDVRAPMLLARVTVRARSMELLARVEGKDKAGQESAFMVGMLSLLGVLFGISLDEVLQPLKISEQMTAALLRHEGELGRLLGMIEAAEAVDTATLIGLLESSGITPDEFNRCYLEAYTWMLGLIRDSGGGVDG